MASFGPVNITMQINIGAVLSPHGMHRACVEQLIANLIRCRFLPVKCKCSHLRHMFALHHVILIISSVDFSAVWYLFMYDISKKLERLCGLVMDRGFEQSRQIQTVTQEDKKFDVCR